MKKNFSEEENLLHGLRQIRDSLSLYKKSTVIFLTILIVSLLIMALFHGSVGFLSFLLIICVLAYGVVSLLIASLGSFDGLFHLGRMDDLVPMHSIVRKSRLYLRVAVVLVPITIIIEFFPESSQREILDSVLGWVYNVVTFFFLISLTNIIDAVSGRLKFYSLQNGGARVRKNLYVRTVIAIVGWLLSLNLHSYNSAVFFIVVAFIGIGWFVYFMHLIERLVDDCYHLAWKKLDMSDYSPKLKVPNEL